MTSVLVLAGGCSLIGKNEQMLVREVYESPYPGLTGLPGCSVTFAQEAEGGEIYVAVAPSLRTVDICRSLRIGQTIPVWTMRGDVYPTVSWEEVM